jgi:hypothetical protein
MYIHAYIRTPWPSADVVVEEGDGARELLVLLARPKQGRPYVTWLAEFLVFEESRTDEKPVETAVNGGVETAVKAELGVVLEMLEWAIVWGYSTALRAEAIPQDIRSTILTL